MKRGRKRANKLEIAQQARNDIKDIWTYIAELNQAAAEKLTAEFLKKFQMPADNPSVGKRHDEIIVNLKSFPHKKYVIFYFETENGVEIYRVLHGARDVENLFEDYFEGLKE